MSIIRSQFADGFYRRMEIQGQMDALDDFEALLQKQCSHEETFEVETETHYETWCGVCEKLLSAVEKYI